jgi:hypothetical protein
MGLRNGDSVVMIEVDPWKRRHVYRGKLVIKGSVPYVHIRSGKDKVGQIVEWTPVWSIAV